MVAIMSLLNRVWRYQRGNQNPYNEEEQTTHWPKEKVQKDKQRSTKHIHKTKDRVTETPLKTRGELKLIYNLFTPRYSWNTAKLGVAHQSINQYILWIDIRQGETTEDILLKNNTERSVPGINICIYLEIGKHVMLNFCMNIWWRKLTVVNT